QRLKQNTQLLKLQEEKRAKQLPTKQTHAPGAKRNRLVPPPRRCVLGHEMTPRSRQSSMKSSVLRGSPLIRRPARSWSHAPDITSAKCVYTLMNAPRNRRKRSTRWHIQLEMMSCLAVDSTHRKHRRDSI